MILNLTEKEVTMLKTAITAKIKRCRSSINNNLKYPTDKSEDQINVRRKQIDEFMELDEKLNQYEPKKATY